MKRLLLLMSLLALPAFAQFEGIVDAINAGPAAYEKFAKEHFAPALLEVQTPERRARFLERLKGDFGNIKAGATKRMSPTQTAIEIAGATGLRAMLLIDHDADKITSVGVRLGGPGDEGPQLPEVPVNGSIADAQITAALDGYIRRLDYQGVVLVARDGKPLFEKAYGLAERGNGIPNTPATRFNVGSINKQFTRVAIEQLAAAGRLAMGDTIEKHIPDFPNATAKKATIGQLLDMRGGLADFFGPEFDKASKDGFRSNRDYYQFVAPKLSNFAPGERRQYCNSCYIVLGEIVERLSGMTYEQFIEQNVFRRAGMSDTCFCATDGIHPSLATGYTKRGGPWRAATLLHGAAGSGAGGAYSTARDLLAFDNALRKGQLVAQNQNEPRAMGYAGGAPGVNAIVENSGPWTVIALANVDPPAAETLGRAIAAALARN